MFIGISRERLVGLGRNGSGAVPDTTTIWNQADAGSITVTGSGLTIENTGVNSQWDMIRATSSAATGKRYYEVTLNLTDTSSGFYIPGVAKSTAVLAGYLGQDAAGWGWQCSKPTPQRVTNATFVNYGATVTPTVNVVGILLDLDAGTLEFTKDGVSQGTAYSGLSGTFFPAFGIYRGIAGGYNATARFKASTWAYTPAGYSQWGV